MKFKSILMTALLAAGILTSATAQENRTGFGLKGGIGLSRLSFENTNANDASNKLKVGGILGVSYEKQIGNGPFSIDVEALIANKGNRNESSLLNANLKINSNIFTIDVPVSAKFYLGDNFNLNFGPYFSYIFGGRIVTERTLNGNTSRNESKDLFDESLKDNNGNFLLNRFDAGFNVGFEFVSNGGFGVGARLNQGLVSVVNKDYNKTLLPGVTIRPDGGALNTTLQIYGLIRF